MAEILTEQVGTVTAKTAITVMKLVCYHDLVGDILGRGRNEQQLIDVAADEGELDMLFALGQADVTSLVETWWKEGEAEALHKRCLSSIADRA